MVCLNHSIFSGPNWAFAKARLNFFAHLKETSIQVLLAGCNQLTQILPEEYTLKPLEQYNQ